MKSNHVFRSRTNDFGSEDSLKRAAKLDPMRRSGKERHQLYSNLDEEDEDLNFLYKKESVLDYFDDGNDDADER